MTISVSRGVAWARRTGAALGLILLGALGCSGRGGETTGAGVLTDRQMTAMAEGLCRTLAESTADTHAARVTFFTEAHTGLHLLAGTLSETHREAAADLLRAKLAVEMGLAESLEPTAELTAALAALHTATRAGLAHLDVTVGPCPAPSASP